MAGGPFDNPLGAKPVLPPPSGAGAQKAAALFQRLVARQQERRAAAEPPPAPPPDDAAISLRVPLRLGPDDFGGGRRYDRALAVWAAIAAELPPYDSPLADFEGEDGSDVDVSSAMEIAFEPEGTPAQPMDVSMHGAPALAHPGDAGERRGPRSEPPFVPLEAHVTGAVAEHDGAEQGLEAEPLGIPLDDALEVPAVPDSFRELLDYVVTEAADEGPAQVAPALDAAPPVVVAEEVRAARPPPGAAVVRPSVPKPAPSPAPDPDLLSKAAQGARLVEEPNGAHVFEIDFADDVFEQLTCRISVQDGRLMAVFRVQNHNLRRLLEAESGRLRAQLEGRGLRVTEIRVEVA